MSEPLTCSECGRRFTLAASVQERFPGWRPSRCRDCHAASGAGTQPHRKGGRRRSGPIEEGLTIAEVLERYDAGPHSGVFTDGSAHPNPGPGGWGAVYVVDDEIIDEAWGHEPETTNNRMELTALIAGYDLVPPGVAATVYTDSRLAVDTITKWAPGWARRGWRRKTGPVENVELVKALYERATSRPEIRLEWIAAHAGARWNEYADALSTAYRREVR